MRRQKAKGSISVFAALCIMMVASTLFTLLEAARVRQMEQLAEVVTTSATESVFAAYDSLLWEQYHLLLRSAALADGAVSFGDIEDELQELSDVAMNPTGGSLTIYQNDLLRAETESVMVTGYTLITDAEGEVFQAAVAAYMKNNLGYEAAKAIKEKYEKGESLEESDVDDAIAEAQDGINEAKQEAAESGEITEETTVEVKDNPLEAIAKIKKMGILSLLAEDTSEISTQSITLSETLSKRELNEGNMSFSEEDSDWYQKILVTQYYAQYYSNYLSPNTDGALQYEQEYLICGKADDTENLKGCINRILLIREAGNLTYLLQDSAKQSEALALATALAGVTANPAIIAAVKYGILAAWAYAESLLDVRALLQGDKIPLVKNAAQWTSDVYGLSQCADSGWKATSCSSGLTYSDYLNLLLYTTGDTKAAYRAMDIQELYLRQQEGYDEFQMDQMIVAMCVTGTYEYTANYLSLVSLVDYGQVKLTASGSCSYSYLQAQQAE